MESSSITGGRRGYQTKPKQKQHHPHQPLHHQQISPQQHQQQSQSQQFHQYQQQQQRTKSATGVPVARLAVFSASRVQQQQHQQQSACFKHRPGDSDSEDSYSDDDIPDNNRYNTTGGNHRYHTVTDGTDKESDCHVERGREPRSLIGGVYDCYHSTTSAAQYCGSQPPPGMGASGCLAAFAPRQPNSQIFGNRPVTPPTPFPHFPPPPDYPPPHQCDTNAIRQQPPPPQAHGKMGLTTIQPTGQTNHNSKRYGGDRGDMIMPNSRSFHDSGGNRIHGGIIDHTVINGLATVRSKLPHTNGKMSEPQGKWIRNNISATMEHFKPGVASTSRDFSDRPECSLDAVRRSFDHPHAQPGPSTSTMPTPNSIRALLMTANRNRMLSPSPKHMYTTRYGTQENIYEEITDEERMHLISGHSMLSLNQNTLEEEFRQVQNRHRRILGELNLSVEALLMPVTPPSDSPTGDEQETAAISTNVNHNNNNGNASCIEELINGAVGPTDELLSPVSAHATLVGDLDSGFSGSSSGGASYVGSLRYRTGLMTRSSTPSGPSSGSMSGSGSCRSSQRSNEDPGILSLSSRSSSLYGSTKVKAAEDPGPAGSKDAKNKTSFWSRKGWRKFPGFSSTSSVNKSGLNNGESNSIFSFDA